MTSHCLLLGHSCAGTRCVHCDAVLPPSWRRSVAEAVLRGALLAALVVGLGLARAAIHEAARPAVAGEAR